MRRGEENGVVDPRLEARGLRTAWKAVIRRGLRRVHLPLLPLLPFLPHLLTGGKWENGRCQPWASGLLALFLGFAWLSSVAAQPAVPPNLLQAAEMAIEDGFTDLALDRLDRVKRAELARGDEWDVAQLEVKAKLQAGDADAALVLINSWKERVPKEEQTAFAFWKAHAERAAGEEADSLSTLKQLGRVLPSDPYFHPLLRLHVRVLADAGQSATALGLFGRYEDEMDGWVDTHPATVLDVGAIGFLAGATNVATEALTRLTGATARGPASQVAHMWLAEWMVAQGELPSAVNHLNAVALNEDAVLGLRLDALKRRGEWQSAAKDFDGATEALTLARNLEPRSQEQTRLSLYQAKILLAMKNPDVGVPLLREAIGTAKDEAEAAAATLELAEFHYREKDYLSAEKAYEAHVRAFSDPVGMGKALLGKGWSVFQQKRYADAAALFERSLKATKDDDTRREAQYMIADAWFAGAEYEKARAAYLAFTQAWPGDSWEARAKFQAALCLNRSGRAQEGESELRVQSKFYPTIAEQAMFEIGQSLQDRRRWDQAVVAYDRYLNTFSNGMYRAEALLKRGLSAYRNEDFSGAEDSFGQLIRTFPRSPLAERGAYMRGWTTYMQGKEKEAQNEFAMFLSAYPKSIWTEDILFWLGERQYNRGEFIEAMGNFVNVAGSFPEGKHVDRSLFWAGRCSMSMERYQEAIDHFAAMVEKRPDSPLVADALYAQGDARTILGEFPEAKAVLNQLIRNHSESYLLPKAWARLGDCHHAKPPEVEEGDDSDGLDDALEAYQNAVKAKGDAPGVKLWAQYQIGKIHERRGQPDAAIDHYTRAVYLYSEFRDRLDKTSRLWFVQSAYGAANLLERQGKVMPAINLYQRVADAGGVEAKDAEAKMTKLRLERPWLMFK